MVQVVLVCMVPQREWCSSLVLPGWECMVLMVLLMWEMLELKPNTLCSTNMAMVKTVECCRDPELVRR